jgi:hypothetical protein
MYLLEARSRMLYLNPGTNYTPWLFIDGASSGSGYSNWQNLILDRASIETPITARIWGNYDPSTRNGIINVRFYSDSTTTLEGNVLFVLTEDSIQRSTPTGDLWHNHVARDYIPDHVGTPVILRYQDSVTVSQSFSLASNWVANQCEIVAMIQNPVAINNTKEIWQGAKVLIPELPMASIEENPPIQKTAYKITVYPNPCINQARFSFSMPAGSEYKIGFFDVSGRTVKTLNGVASGNNDLVNCDLRSSVTPGIYFYQFESSNGTAHGKIIVQ